MAEAAGRQNLLNQRPILPTQVHEGVAVAYVSTLLGLGVLIHTHVTMSRCRHDRRQRYKLLLAAMVVVCLCASGASALEAAAAGGVDGTAGGGAAVGVDAGADAMNQTPLDERTGVAGAAGGIEVNLTVSEPVTCVLLPAGCVAFAPVV